MNRQASTPPDRLPPPPITFTRLMAICMAARLLVDTGVQIFNPYLAIIAAGLGTNVVVMGRLVSLRSAMGLLSPIFGTLADRVGYRLVLRLALLIGACGLFVVGSSTHIVAAAMGMALTGIGLAGFVPTLQAYMSARLPYATRARGMGILEYSWALTGILGLSLMGQLIEYAGWRAPFIVLSAGMIVMSAVLRVLPKVGGQMRAPPLYIATAPDSQYRTRRIRLFFALGPNAESTYGTIFSSALNFFAAMQIMIIYGVWLSDTYRLTAGQLGMVAMILGCFDLAASVSVSLFTDRIGKRRSVVLGSVGALMGYLLMPWLNIAIVPAIIGIGLARGCFEFAIVSSFPLLSEQAPAQRGKVMALNAAISLSAATLAGLIGPVLYARFGIGVTAYLSAACTALSLFTLHIAVRDIDHSDTEPAAL